MNTLIIKKKLKKKKTKLISMYVNNKIVVRSDRCYLKKKKKIILETLLSSYRKSFDINRKHHRDFYTLSFYKVLILDLGDNSHKNHLTVGFRKEVIRPCKLLHRVRAIFIEIRFFTNTLD